MMHILDSQHNPIKLEVNSENIQKVMEFMAKDGHVVMQTKMASPDSEKHILVSTIFLCFAICGTPQFETMIFEEEGDFLDSKMQYQVRSSSWNEAIDQHGIAEKYAVDIISADVLKDSLN